MDIKHIVDSFFIISSSYSKPNKKHQNAFLYNSNHVSNINLYGSYDKIITNEKQHLKPEMTSPTTMTTSSPSAITKTTAPVATIMSVSSSNDDMTTMTKTMIENATEGLPSRYYNSLYNTILPTSGGKQNTLTICDYISSLKSEINPSCNYRRDTIVLLYILSTCINQTINQKIAS